MCVALSRAKIGFYICGNATLLRQKSELWRKIFSYLEGADLIGSHLLLQVRPSRSSVLS